MALWQVLSGTVILDMSRRTSIKKIASSMLEHHPLVTDYNCSISSLRTDEVQFTITINATHKETSILTELAQAILSKVYKADFEMVIRYYK